MSTMNAQLYNCADEYLFLTLSALVARKMAALLSYFNLEKSYSWCYHVFNNSIDLISNI